MRIGRTGPNPVGALGLIYPGPIDCALVLIGLLVTCAQQRGTLTSDIINGASTLLASMAPTLQQTGEDLRRAPRLIQRNRGKAAALEHSLDDYCCVRRITRLGESHCRRLLASIRGVVDHH